MHRMLLIHVLKATLSHLCEGELVGVTTDSDQAGVVAYRVLETGEVKEAKWVLVRVGEVEVIALTLGGGPATNPSVVRVAAPGNEPCVTLFFSDGTKHGFVLPAD